MRRRLTNNTAEATLNRILQPLLLKHHLSIRRETVAACGFLYDELCGNKEIRGHDAVFIIYGIDATAPILVRSDFDFHLPKWLARLADIPTDEVYACQPSEEALAEFLNPLLPQIEAKMAGLAKDVERILRTRKLSESLNHLTSADLGGSATVYPGTQGTVDLKIKLVHVTPEDARELLSFLNPFISSLTNH